MKKLTKTMKSIIIASISLVCVAAIVLGCVFGLKKNEKPDDSHQRFLAAQEKFETAINASQSEELYSEIDPDCYDSALGNGSLNAFDENYFTVKTTSGNEEFYIYQKNEDEEYERKNLTSSEYSFVKQGTGVKGYDVLDAVNGYALILTYFETPADGLLDDYLCIVDYSDFENPTKVFELDLSASEVVAYEFYLEKEYFVYYVANASYEIDVYVDAYSSAKTS